MALYEAHHRFARFLTIYTNEANPLDVWQGADGYRGSGARRHRAKDLHEKAKLAAEFVQAHSWKSDLVLDTMAGDAGNMFALLPFGALWLGVVSDLKVVVASRPPPFDYEVGPTKVWLAKHAAEVTGNATPADCH
mmetsp:Transcript_32108/g.73586  ORF Transcript_32108/g.73586 Transcript_32108/m.73586 type:complete len:135 (-) Transcript_32108:96-500(-)